MKKIILDTNFLLTPGRFKVDIFSELERIMNEPYEIYIFDRSLEELEKIKKNGSGKDKQAVEIAIKLLNTKALKTISCSRYVDDAILEFAEPNTLVATQDLELKKKLRKKGISVISLKQKKILKIER